MKRFVVAFLVLFIGLTVCSIYVRYQSEGHVSEKSPTNGAQLIDETNRVLIGTQIQDTLTNPHKDDGTGCPFMKNEFSDQWDIIANLDIIIGPATADLIPPISMEEFSTYNGITPEVLLKNGDCVVFTTEDRTGWHCKTGQELSFTFEKYLSELSTSQNMTVGYICDGTLYEGTVFTTTSDTYLIDISIDGNYEIYIISGTSDYLALKEGRITLE